MKRTLSLILIMCIYFLSLSACGFQKNTDEEKAANDTKVTSQTNKDLEDEPNFSFDAKPVNGKEYIGDRFTYILYDDNSVEITSYTGDEAEISIPSRINEYSVSRIGASAFTNCTFLEEVNIWADVIIIGESAFKGCTGLKEISIPSSCLSVGKSAFEGCTDMEEVNLWGGEVIGESAFKNCTSLKEFSIPSEVTMVKESAFEGCKSLKKVNVWGDNVTFGVNVFFNCQKLEELPDGAYPDGVYSNDSSSISQDDNKKDNNKTVNDVSPSQETSAEKQNNVSNDIFDPYDYAVIVCQSIKDSLYNPDSIQIHKVYYIDAYWHNYYIDFSAMNQIGGYTRESYEAMFNKDSSLYRFNKVYDLPDTFEEYDYETLDIDVIESNLK